MPARSDGLRPDGLCAYLTLNTAQLGQSQPVVPLSMQLHYVYRSHSLTPALPARYAPVCRYRHITNLSLKREKNPALASTRPLYTTSTTAGSSVAAASIVPTSLGMIVTAWAFHEAWAEVICGPLRPQF